jgi:phosphomannomutase
MENIKSIVFDLGGVVVPEVEGDVLAYASDKLGIEASELKELIEKYETQLCVGSITPVEFWKKIIAEKGKTFPDEFLSDLLLTPYKEHALLNEGILAFIKQLRKSYSVGTISNTHEPHVSFNRERRLFENFDHVILSNEVGYRKPDKMIFRLYMGRSNCRADQTIYIDDREQMLEGAREVGFQTVLFKNLDQLKKELKSLGVITDDMSGVFKSYDIRGIYPKELDEQFAYLLGKSAAEYFKSKNKNNTKQIIVVGEDARLSSRKLVDELVRGITESGTDVYLLGQCSTPLFYFSVSMFKEVLGGIMVTASHNPPEYNGFKVISAGAVPVGLNSGLSDIKQLIDKHIKEITTGKKEEVKAGIVKKIDLAKDYVSYVINAAKIKEKIFNKYKIIIDASNGMSPVVLKPLFERLNSNYIPLNFVIDGTFPNHAPDISKSENLRELKEKVVAESADIGVAFDGDGDRIFFIDRTGKTVSPDFILGLLFDHRSGFLSRPVTAYDLRFSWAIKKHLGFRGIRTKVGHSNIKAEMRKAKASIGAELSGHFFFKEMNYSEGPELVLLEVLKIMSETGQPLEKLVKKFEKYFYSGEVNLEIGDGEKGKKITALLKQKYTGAKKIDELDGLTVEYKDWWFNLRPSNTEPILRLVVEAKTKAMMEEKITEIQEEIKKAA